MRKTANRKLTAGNIAKPPRRRDPATTPHSSRLQVQRYGYRGRGKDCQDVVEAKSGAICAFSRYGATPGHGERTGRGKRRRCPSRPEVEPSERLCNLFERSRANWICRHRTRCVDTLMIGVTSRTESGLPTSELYSASAIRQTDTDPPEAMS